MTSQLQARPVLAGDSVGVAEFADDGARFGLIHRPQSKRLQAGVYSHRNRYPHRVCCGPALKSAKPIEYADGETTANDWCGKCFDLDAITCAGALRAGPFSPYTKYATPVCNDHGDLTRGHIERDTARDILEQHLRTGGRR